MDNQKITVRIDSSRPVFIEADPDEFGSIFSHLNDHDQIEVLRSMVKHMKPHRSQWDYIAIQLEKDENRDVFNDLSVLFPVTETLVAQIEALQAELASTIEELIDHTGDDMIDSRAKRVAELRTLSPSSPPTE